MSGRLRFNSFALAHAAALAGLGISRGGKPQVLVPWLVIRTIVIVTGLLAAAGAAREPVTA